MLIPPREPDPLQQTNLLFMVLTGVHFQIQTVSCKPGVSRALLTIVRHTKSSPNRVYFVFFCISILIAKYFVDYRYPWYVNISMG